MSDLEALPRIDYCGEIYALAPGRPLSLGRAGDVVIDEDNAFLHRIFLILTAGGGLVWVENVGSQLSATVSDVDGLAETWLGPGARVPLVFPHSTVLFTAGAVTYSLDVLLPEAPFQMASPPQSTATETTIAPVNFTPDQKLLCMVLCEPVLRRGRGAGRGQIPASGVAAERLGWTATKFNRKLDNVCEKLAKLGVRGLTPLPGQPASGRRARLVEYVVASRLVTKDDLSLLDAAIRFGDQQQR